MKIFISFHTPITDDNLWEPYSFHESFIQGLSGMGHDIDYMVTNDFLCQSFVAPDNKTLFFINDEKLKSYIKSKDYDLVIALNHSLPDFIKDITDCPIVVLDSDTVVTFNDLDELKNNSSRYHFGCFSTYGMADAKTSFGKDAKIFHAPYATSIKQYDTEFIHNISFIGTYFCVSPKLLMYTFKNREFLLATLEEYERSKSNNTDFDLDAFAKSHGIQEKLDFSVHSGLRGYKSGAWRNQVVAAVAPLGINLRGSLDWVNIANFSTEAFEGFNPKKIYSLKDLNHTYNSSKISLNTSHDQVISGYSWRVLDILASNSCLVTDKCTDLYNHFPKELIQTYSSPEEARKLSEYLLKHDDERTDIVNESNKIINEKFRWNVIFLQWLDAIGIKNDISSGNKIGEVNRIDKNNFIKSERVYTYFSKVVLLSLPENKKGIKKASFIRRLIKRMLPRIYYSIVEIRNRYNG
ncbi:MAG: glycosyltransferase [Alphaproteobacteria bacterium]|nr:glycosyltransferase [Alphaproteobacteria bacterium]